MICMFIWSGCAGSGTSADGNDPADIHAAVARGDEAALTNYLSGDNDINVKDPFGGSSPLITAAVFGQTEMAKRLIDAGADINFRNNEGSTALISAAFFGRREIVELLLAAGADRRIKNKYGATAYDSVAAPFSDVKSTYDMIVQALEPMGLKIDYAYLEKVRPQIAELLR